MDIDEQINERNQKLYKDWFDNDKIVFKLINDITDQTINVTLEGDFKTCKNCRDKILTGYHWQQGSLQRKDKQEVYVIMQITPHDGSFLEIVYTDEEEAKKHCETFNKEHKKDSMDEYCKYYTIELKNKCDSSS